MTKEEIYEILDLEEFIRSIECEELEEEQKLLIAQKRLRTVFELD